MAKKLKWGTIEYLNTLIDEYFTGEPLPSISGLRLVLNISHECWSYYIQDKWKTHRKTDEEIEEISKNIIETDANGIYEELIEISEKNVIYADDDIENDALKARVSATLKKARDKIDIFNYKAMMTNKNPAGPIFYAKAALGYRETDPVDNVAQQLPTKIVINILPAQPLQPIKVVECTDYEVLPDSNNSR